MKRAIYEQSPFVLDWKQKRSRSFANVHSNHFILIGHIWIDQNIGRYLPTYISPFADPKNIILINVIVMITFQGTHLIFTILQLYIHSSFYAIHPIILYLNPKKLQKSKHPKTYAF